jgi:four helix bundle protein
MPSRRVEDVIVWQRARRWALATHRHTESWSAHEDYALRTQLRGSAVSIPANIAEGFARRPMRDKTRFCNIAQGSIEECRYYLELSHDLGYRETPLLRDLDEIGRPPASYARATVRSPATPR